MGNGMCVVFISQSTSVLRTGASTEQEGTAIRGSETDKNLWATGTEFNCSTGK